MDFLFLFTVLVVVPCAFALGLWFRDSVPVQRDEPEPTPEPRVQYETRPVHWHELPAFLQEAGREAAWR
jgi:hypothetical protein